MNITELVIIATFVLLIAYDVIAGKINQPTESMVLREWGWRWNTVPFLAGFLIGHWFFPRREVDVSGWMWVLPILGGLIVFDILWGRFGRNSRPWFRFPGWYVLLGIPVGMFLWGQASVESVFK